MRLILKAKPKQVFATSATAEGGWLSSLELSGKIKSKPNGRAGIELDGNAATGNFTLSLSPANVTSDRRWSFPDRSDTVAGLATQTFTGVQVFSSGATFNANILQAAASGVQFEMQNSSDSDRGLRISCTTGVGAKIATQSGVYSLILGADNGSHLTIAPGAGDVTLSSTTDATGTTAAALVVTGGIAWGATKTAYGGFLNLTAGTTAKASLNLPHGSAPSSPVNGDIWTTTAGLFVRINGATVGPLS